jgi:hypothetical protein
VTPLCMQCSAPSSSCPDILNTLISNTRQPRVSKKVCRGCVLISGCDDLRSRHRRQKLVISACFGFRLVGDMRWGTNSTSQHRRHDVTCLSLHVSALLRSEQQLKLRRQRSFVYVALTVVCLFSRLAGGWSGVWGEAGEMWGGQQGGSAGASGVAFV